MTNTISIQESFISRVKNYFPYRVVINEESYDMIDVIEMFGEDEMPRWSSNITGNWTMAPEDEGDAFFFKDARDAVEFKLRFG